MKRTHLLFILLLPLALAAQSYDFALGLRLGTDWGATAQLRLPHLHKNFVLEGILQQSIGRDEGTFTLLGKQHRPLLSRRLNLFYGAGLHAGWSSEVDKETGETFSGPAGVTGVLGAEITFNRINISYDVKPALNMTGGGSFFSPQTGISVRYVLAKRNGLWDKDKEKDMKKRRKKRRREKKRAEREGRWWQVWKRE